MDNDNNNNDSDNNNNNGCWISMPGLALSAYTDYLVLSSQQPSDIGTIIIFILQMRKLRLKRWESLAQGRQWNLHLNQSLSDTKVPNSKSEHMAWHSINMKFTTHLQEEIAGPLATLPRHSLGPEFWEARFFFYLFSSIIYHHVTY